MPTVADRLLEATRGLPEALVAEVLDFAEFLQCKKQVDSAGAHPGAQQRGGGDSGA